MTPTEKAVALMKTIGLDITYTDEGLRIVAEQIGEAYRADERDRIRTELLSLASERAGVAGSKPSWSVMVGTIGTVPGAESGPMGPELEETS